MAGVLSEIGLPLLARRPCCRASGAIASTGAVFTNPEALRPEKTPAQITEEAARRFAEIARRLSARGHNPKVVAHFLDRILFCLFAEDAGLLPRGILTGLIDSRQRQPVEFTAALRELFGLMAVKGGYWGNHRIDWFNRDWPPMRQRTTRLPRPDTGRSSFAASAPTSPRKQQ